MKTAPIASIYLITTNSIVTFRAQVRSSKPNTGTGGTLTRTKTIKTIDRITIATKGGLTAEGPLLSHSRVNAGADS
jgi:hypothetical protein